MVILDSIILNTDRHLNNFGFLRASDTLDWKGFAPIYDSGTSMLHNVSVPVLRTNAENEIYQLKSKPFYNSFFDQLIKLPCRDYFDKLDFSKLNGITTYFRTILNENINISPERADLLCTILDNQIRDVRNCLRFNRTNQK